MEPLFHVIKNLFGYRKDYYRGITKARAKASAASGNMAGRRLPAQEVSASAARAGAGKWLKNARQTP